MAHANPEFALGLAAIRDAIPDAGERMSVGAMRAAMMRLVRMAPDDRTPEEHALVCQYRRALRQTCIVEGMQRATAHLDERGGGMHGMGKAGERFVEPRRRFSHSGGTGNV